MTSGTFSDQYKFKRLLQTDPDLVKRYNNQQKAINSIPAVKDVAIYEGPELLEYVPFEHITAADTAPYTLLSQGTAEWPRRVIFAEQIRQLYEDGRPVWSINLTVSTANDYVSKQTAKAYHVRIQRVTAPVIATQRKSVGWRPEFEPVPKEQLRKIDANDNVFFYLIDASTPTQEQEPWDVSSAGLVPTMFSEFNACFYDREVAHLYAESLRVEVRRIEKMYFKN